MPIDDNFTIDEDYVEQFKRCSPSAPIFDQSKHILEKKGIAQFKKYDEINLTHYINIDLNMNYISLIDLNPDDGAFLIIETKIFINKKRTVSYNPMIHKNMISLDN